MTKKDIENVKPQLHTLESPFELTKLKKYTSSPETDLIAQ